MRSSLGGGHALGQIGFAAGFEPLRLFDARAPELHSTSTGRGDALGLPLMNVLSLNLRNVAQKLQHQIGNKLAGYARAISPRVQEGHIEHHKARPV